jgi:phosphoribosyl 1,2-cyclic phosphodiesterase/DNA-binding response OmpR family regulator
MQIRFWGTRGSIPKAGPGTVRYGGNTACVEVRSATGTLLVLDCGSGGHGLGQALVAGGRPLRGHMLFTHTHWDHIQGVPFFAPLFDPRHEWDIYGPWTLGPTLRDALTGQMQYLYFPVPLDECAATTRYHDLVEGSFQIGDIRVTARYLNHPLLTLGYRLEADGVVVVYSTDHEPHARELGAGTDRLEGEDKRHAEFLAGADLVIHDAQYTAEEYPAKVGWGHSTVEYVTAVARAAAIRQLALFHHDPLRDDAGVERLVDIARRRVDAAHADLHVFAAAEGHVVEIGRANVTAPADPRDGPAATARPADLRQHSVVVAVTDQTAATRLTDAVHADSVRLHTTSDAATAVRLARKERPSLVILSRDLPELGGFAVARMIRSEPAAWATDVPIVLVAASATAEDRAAGAEMGITDWLVTPFSAAYARTRIRAWLLRSACRCAAPAVPANEDARLAALRDLRILDTPPEERFDRLTRLAAAAFDVPIVMVSLIDSERQWFKSYHGLAFRETPRDVSFCAHAILGDGITVVADTLADARFADNPAVTAEPGIRFYAGCPLSVGDGLRVGTLCLIDRRPRQLDGAGLELLRDLGALVESELIARRD